MLTNAIWSSRYGTGDQSLRSVGPNQTVEKENTYALDFQRETFAHKEHKRKLNEVGIQSVHKVRIPLY